MLTSTPSWNNVDDKNQKRRLPGKCYGKAIYSNSNENSESSFTPVRKKQKTTITLKGNY